MKYLATFTLGIITGVVVFVAADRTLSPFHEIEGRGYSPRTEIQIAADIICDDLLKMYKAQPQDAMGALALVRCGVLEETKRSRK